MVKKLEEAYKRIAELEAELESKSSLVNSLVINSPFAVQIYDMNGYVIESNDAVIKVFGAPPPPGYNIFEDPVLIESGIADEIKRVKLGEFVDVPDNWYNIQRLSPELPDRERCVHTFIFPIFNAAGQPESFMLMHEDVTKRKMAEEKFRLAFDCSPTPMTISEAGGGAYIEVNQAALDLSGYTRDEMIGGSRQDLGIFNREDLEKIIVELRQKGRIRNMETTLHKKNGEIVYALTNCDLIEIASRLHVLSTSLDITERKRMEKALQDSEARFRLFAEKALDGFAIIIGNRCTYANQSFCNMIGYSQEELLALPDLYPIMPDTKLGQELIMDRYARRVQGEIADEQYEAQLLHRDGGTVVDVVLSPATAIIGGETYVFMLISDITARKKADAEREASLAAVQASEEKYRSLFMYTPGGVVTFDCNLVVTDFNDRFVEIWKSDRSRLMGMHLPALKDPSLLPAFEKVLEGQEGFYEGLYSATTSEVVKWISMRTAPVYDAEGIIVGGLGIVEDINPRREAEMERDRLSHLLESTFDSMPSILVGIDAERRITHWNREAALRTGLIPSEAQNRLLEEALPIIQPLTKDINKALKQRRLKRIDRMSYIEEGELHYAEVMIYPLMHYEMTGAVIRLDDITEKVVMEEIVVQSEKMMTVGGMAAGMAHEINNPLGGIVQGAQNVLRRLSADNQINRNEAEKCGISMDAIREYADRRDILSLVEGIQTSGIRAANIVANMLQFSRASSTAREYADISDLVERTIELADSDYDLKTGYDFRHIDIVRDYAPDLPAIMCSPVEIEQVLLNLFKNAAQAMAGSAKKPVIKVKTRRERKWVVLEVADNGPGMDESIRRRVFEPFFTTKSTGAGTGLGLAVSYYIITNNHQGQIYVESKAGKGTVFKVRLPIN